MTDREKVIKGLEETEIMLKQAVDRGGEMAVMGAFKCYNHVSDAIAMLKEQEPKPQSYKEHDIFHLPFCPNTVCNAVLDKYWHYCPYCGTKFYWDEELDEQQKMVKWDDI